MLLRGQHAPNEILFMKGAAVKRPEIHLSLAASSSVIKGHAFILPTPHKGMQCLTSYPPL